MMFRFSRKPVRNILEYPFAKGKTILLIIICKGKVLFYKKPVLLQSER